mgnify:CR=1 FL=1
MYYLLKNLKKFEKFDKMATIQEIKIPLKDEYPDVENHFVTKTTKNGQDEYQMFFHLNSSRNQDTDGASINYSINKDVFDFVKSNSDGIDMATICKELPCKEGIIRTYFKNENINGNKIFADVIMRVIETDNIDLFPNSIKDAIIAKSENDFYVVACDDALIDTYEDLLEDFQLSKKSSLKS